MCMFDIHTPLENKAKLKENSNRKRNRKKSEDILSTYEGCLFIMLFLLELSVSGYLS